MSRKRWTVMQFLLCAARHVDGEAGVRVGPRGYKKPFGAGRGEGVAEYSKDAHLRLTVFIIPSLPERSWHGAERAFQVRAVEGGELKTEEGRAAWRELFAAVDFYLNENVFPNEAYFAESPVYLSRREIANEYEVSVDTVARWAMQNAWRVRWYKLSLEYHVDDVRRDAPNLKAGRGASLL